MLHNMQHWRVLYYNAVLTCFLTTVPLHGYRMVAFRTPIFCTLLWAPTVTVCDYAPCCHSNMTNLNLKGAHYCCASLNKAVVAFAIYRPCIYSYGFFTDFHCGRPQRVSRSVWSACFQQTIRTLSTCVLRFTTPWIYKRTDCLTAPRALAPYLHRAPFRASQERLKHLQRLQTYKRSFW